MQSEIPQNGTYNPSHSMIALSRGIYFKSFSKNKNHKEKINKQICNTVQTI